ncbi:MAG TPA: GNAT family N-acetyltransferase [Thermomicrobiales bacterium]|nr:GNAT family N-acetyltransferase [Thermomicrobiales bacterium]
MQPNPGRLVHALRPATPDDAEFIHAARVLGLRPYVERTWGWDDAEQAARFHARFDPARYQVIVVGGVDVGALSVERSADELFIADIEILPEWRGRGLGAAIIAALIGEARQRGLPTTLQVTKVNPVIRLYRRLGFDIVGESATHVRMSAPAVAHAAVDST